MKREKHYTILRNGKVMVVMPSGEWWINGHIETKEGREIAMLNGYAFELKELNIKEDLR